MGMNPDDLGEPPASGADPSRPEMFPRSYVEQLRAENAQHRTRNKQLETQITKLSDSAAQIRDLKLSNALLKHGAADPELTEFLLRKAGKWDDLDPQADDFAETLGDRVDELIRERPELRGGRRMASASSTSTMSSGGPGMTSTQLTRETVKQMRPDQVEEALKRGDLNQLLGRR